MYHVPDEDLEVLRAAEQRGARSSAETSEIVDSWDIEDEIAAMMHRLGLHETTLP